MQEKHAINGIIILHNILSNLFLYIIKEFKKKKQKDWTKFDEMNLKKKKNYVSETKLKYHILYIFIMNYRKRRNSFKKTQPELYNFKVGLTPNQNPSDSEAILLPIISFFRINVINICLLIDHCCVLFP